MLSITDPAADFIYEFSLKSVFKSLVFVISIIIFESLLASCQIYKSSNLFIVVKTVKPLNDRNL